MKKLLITLAVLFSAHCSALHIDWESMFEGEWQESHYNAKRYIITAEFLLGAQDENQICLFKACLAIESSVMEKALLRELKDCEMQIRYYQEHPEKENADVIIEGYKTAHSRYYEKIKQVRLLTAEIMSHK